ncbi:MAG: hypothetical protein M1838_004237 [Thelocarpon superellum]|nr:MAG: hypothetical protein M1838_004237 [Thelocarpon superellum]
MDVDRSSFHLLLPSLLDVIHRAHFVAIDFEFSGIHQQPQRAHRARSGGRRRQTLQQRYSETKAAAEKYQILQVGLTCVEQDTANDRYITRPYNFDLSPLISEKLDLDRDFSFQSGAVEFLLAHGFHLEAPFLTGVPYLSRSEECQVRQQTSGPRGQSGIADIVLKDHDLDSREFMRRVRGEITAWLDITTPSQSEEAYLNIAPLGIGGEHENHLNLNNFQKRLVHQLVRAEFPDLVTVSRPGFIQVLMYDKKREDAVALSRKRRVDEQLSRQIGFRWVLEAMSGGDLSGIDAAGFARDPHGEPIFVDLDAIKSHFDGLRGQLRRHRSVLVGHNLFTDVVYLYQAFFGALPDTVEDFRYCLHDLFPLIIDTKYLATHQTIAANPKSSLQEIDEQLRSQAIPTIETAPDHSKYNLREVAHEAGYDSLLTAQVLIKLSTKLHAANRPATEMEAAALESDKDDSERASQDGGVRLEPPKAKPPRKKGILAQHSGNEPVTSGSRFAALLDLSSESEWDPSSTAQGPVKSHQPRGTPRRSAHGARLDPSHTMPPFQGEFWKVYGNKLRVFGTEEEVFDLDSS